MIIVNGERPKLGNVFMLEWMCKLRAGGLRGGGQRKKGKRQKSGKKLPSPSPTSRRGGRRSRPHFTGTAKLNCDEGRSGFLQSHRYFRSLPRVPHAKRLTINFCARTPLNLFAVNSFCYFNSFRFFPIGWKCSCMFHLFMFIIHMYIESLELNLILTFYTITETRR